jgi:N,N-dimethylformamidase
MIPAAEMTGRQMHFNGKIDSPTVYVGPLDLDTLEGQTDGVPVFACWDFSRDISSCRVVDSGPNQLTGTLINFPARAMTGANWDGTEMCWRHLPHQYGAIHFHEDDIYDFEWETDFSFVVPNDLRSGIYGIRLEQEDQHDTIPLFVCPPRDKRTARLCVLVSTFTYTVYGNHARPDYEPSWLDRNEAWNAYPWNPAEYPHYGCSTYNFHSDRSGICHASHRRPLFNLRPGYLTFGANACSGLRHFQADSHLTAWLENQGYSFDVITDKELHDEGVAVLSGYAAVTTGSHPEYHTARTLDALQQYRDQGGHLAYLGGNGFYWRVAIHPENSSLIEIRRAEGGIRAWAAEPGEYYNAFDGQYGGLWRRNGRPPQQLAGVGFSSQGRFFGSYYRRTPESYDERFSWMFDGISDELIGDFGFSGGGAAGFELDRYDRYLGSPQNAVVVASSENHNDTFVLVPEEQLTHITNWPGVPNEELIRADMVYFDTPSGGAVFSTGSITFCGSLPHNNFDNNISRLMKNILLLNVDCMKM